MAAYLIVDNQSNLVTNSVEWDGDTSIWQPPSNTTAFILSNSYGWAWRLTDDKSDWELVRNLGDVGIGFKLENGDFYTQESKPDLPTMPPPGQTEGVQSL